MFAVLAGPLIVANHSLGADRGGTADVGLREPYETSAGWEFRLTPYAWLLNLNGDVSARGIT